MKKGAIKITKKTSSTIRYSFLLAGGAALFCLVACSLYAHKLHTHTDTHTLTHVKRFSLLLLVSDLERIFFIYRIPKGIGKAICMYENLCVYLFKRYHVLVSANGCVKTTLLVP